MNIEYRIGDDGKHHVYLDGEYAKPGFSFTDEMFKARDDGRKTVTRWLHKKPKFELHQIVYVKEALVCGGDSCAYYYSDQQPVIAHDTLLGWRWKRDRLPAMFMPGIAARRFDRITEVRAERLQDIPYYDFRPEGWDINSGTSAVDWFFNLWNSINPKQPWASNPWVFVYKFEVIT